MTRRVSQPRNRSMSGQPGRLVMKLNRLLHPSVLPVAWMSLDGEFQADAGAVGNATHWIGYVWVDVPFQTCLIAPRGTRKFVVGLIRGEAAVRSRWEKYMRKVVRRRVMGAMIKRYCSSFFGSRQEIVEIRSSESRFRFFDDLKVLRDLKNTEVDIESNKRNYVVFLLSCVQCLHNARYKEGSNEQNCLHQAAIHICIRRMNLSHSRQAVLCTHPRK